MAFTTKPVLHQNQPSRESIFCGEAGGWCRKKGSQCVKFLTENWTRVIVVRTRVWAMAHKTRTPTNTSANGCRACCSRLTKTVSWKHRNHLLETQKPSAISSLFSTCRESVKPQLVVRPLINYFRSFPSLSARLPFACWYLVCLILST